MRHGWLTLAVVGLLFLLLTQTQALAGEGPAPQSLNRPTACAPSVNDNATTTAPDGGLSQTGTLCLARIESVPVVRTPVVLVEPALDPVEKPRPIVRKGIAPELLAFLREIHARIVEAREYPPNAITLGLQGTTTVKLTLQPDGAAPTVRIRKSSGHGMLDEAAIEAVRKVLPLRPPPKAGTHPLELDIPISFALR